MIINRRSNWKGNYVSNSVLRKLKSRDIFTTHSRSSTILPFMRGKKIYVYNGCSYFPIIITRSMYGQKLGSFAVTTRLGNTIHLSKRNLKKKKKK